MTILSGQAGTVSYNVTGVPAGFNFSGSPTTTAATSRIQVTDFANMFKAPSNNLDFGLNPAAFAIPALSQRGLGNAPPVLFWGPGSWNADISLFKIFKVKEKLELEFRMETYNTFNHPNYGLPAASSLQYQTAWNNGNFGPNNNIYFGSFLSSAGTVSISSTARVSVLAMKVRF